MAPTLKKILSSVTTLTTMLWSVGFGVFSMPSVASAAVLNSGDLIKASGPAVYYYANDQKRYVFPNEKTYFSWYNDFSSVRTISDAELAAIAIGGNVTIRPGTKLVKITTDPKVYAVTRCGLLHWVESEAVATALWGGAWASKVVDVPDGFFVNYSVGSSIPSAVHPDGSLITYTGDTNKYVVWGGQKRKFASDAAFMANNFNALNVITTTISYANGADVTGREGDLADVVCTTAPAAGMLTVALASDTPAGATLPKNSSSVQVAKFNLIAGSAAVTVTGLRLHRVGVGATTDISNVYLYDGAGARLTTGRTVNSTTNNAEFNSLAINVPAGGMTSIVVVIDLSNPSTTGGQHSFEIQDAASAVISGTGTVSGSFPVRGNVFTVGTASAGRLDIQKGTQPTNPNIGATDAEISNFKLTANTNDIEVRRITILQAGSITNTDLTDLKLYQGTTVVATAAALTGDKIILNFNPAYLLTNGTTKTFSLHARVGGRADRTIKTYVEYTTDVYAIDKIYNAGAAVCINSTSTGCTSSSANFDGVGSFNSITVTTQGGQLTVSFNGPPSQNIAKGVQDTVLYKFSLASPDNRLEIRNIDFKIQGQVNGAGGAAMVKGSSGTDYFRDIKIKNLDTGATIMGPTSFSGVSNGANDSGIITLSDSFTMNAGQILNLGITSDLANTEDVANQFFGSGTSTYKVILADSSGALFGSSDVRIVDTGEFLATSKIVPNSTISGNNQIVKASSLDIALASSPVSATVVKKQAMIPSVAFVLTAGAQSDIRVTALKMTGRGDTTGAFTTANLLNVITSCALFDGTTQVGLSRVPESDGTMNITNMSVTIGRGTSKTLTAKCTADSTVTQSTGDRFAIGIAAAGDVTAEDGDANGVTPTINAGLSANSGASPTVIQTVRNSGTITVQTNNLRQSTILVAGGDVWQNFAQFQATAQFEDVNIDRVNVSSTNDAANYTAVAVAKDGAVKAWNVLPSGSFQNKDLDLTTSPIVVPNNGSVTFQLWGKLNNVSSSSSVNGATTGVARSGNQTTLGLGAGIVGGEWSEVGYANSYNVRNIGAASGEKIFAATSTVGFGVMGNNFVVRKTKPTVTRQALSSTTIAAGTDQDLYKFQVASDSAGSMALKKFVFNFSKTTAASFTLSNFRLRRGSSDMALADIVITDGMGGDLEAQSLGSASTTGKIVVAFTNEETNSGSGNVYTLHATVGGSPATGDTLSLSFDRQSTSLVTTGYLIATATSTVGGGVTTTTGPNIDTGAAPGGLATAIEYGTFVWSDNSEVPHSSAVGTAGGSRDWTNDVYVEDLTSAQVLSK